MGGASLIDRLVQWQQKERQLMTFRILSLDSEGGGPISVWLFHFCQATGRPYDYTLGEYWSYS